MVGKKALLVAMGLSVFSSVQAVDLEAGKDAFETCRGCHAAPGSSNAYPTYYVPKVSGQVAGYTAAALSAYKEAKRPRGAMYANSYNLSEQMIENIAAYLEAETEGSMTAIANGGDAKKGKTLAAACMGCHSEEKPTSGSNPWLAGQHANYLERAIKDYQSGKRDNALMQSMVKGLSEDDIRDVSAYFNSLKGLRTVN